jgi:polar amino acid transport system ATP-binding protein
MVFQFFNLFRHLTATENVMLGFRKIRGLSRAEAREVAERWLVRDGLDDKLKSLPIELSGGQQQRVGIARAVAMSPGPAAGRNHIGARSGARRRGAESRALTRE